MPQGKYNEIRTRMNIKAHESCDTLSRTFFILLRTRRGAAIISFYNYLWRAYKISFNIGLEEMDFSFELQVSHKTIFSSKTLTNMLNNFWSTSSYPLIMNSIPHNKMRKKEKIYFILLIHLTMCYKYVFYCSKLWW